MERKREQQEGAEREGRVAAGEDALARHVIGGVAGGQKEEDAGEELGESDIAEVERAVSESEDLPATATACISDAPVMRAREAMK